MKRSVFHSFSFMLVLALLLASTGAAIAAPLNDSPVVSAPSGGGVVTTTIIPVNDLPGTVANAAGTIFPQGHESGDQMFSGDGVKVSGLVGYATISFPLVNYQYGWFGNVYQFMNEEWVPLPTTTVQKSESPDANASATIYSDGTYALIVTYKEPAAQAEGECKNVQMMLYGHYDEGFIYYESADVYGDLDPNKFPEGKTFDYKVFSLDPGIEFSGDYSGTMTVVNVETDDDGTSVILLLPEDTRVYYTGENFEPPFTFRIYLNGCHVDFTVDYSDETTG